MLILEKNKRIKRYHIKGIGCPLLISINIVIFDQETENEKEEKMVGYRKTRGIVMKPTTIINKTKFLSDMIAKFKEKIIKQGKAQKPHTAGVNQQQID